MLPFTLPPEVLLAAAPPDVELELLFDEPQPAATRATITARAARPHHVFLGTVLPPPVSADRLVRTLFKRQFALLPNRSRDRLTSPQPHARARRTRGRTGRRRGSGPRAARLALRAPPARPSRRPPPLESRSGERRRAWARARARRREKRLRRCPLARG